MWRLQTATCVPVLTLMLVCTLLLVPVHAKPARTDACAYDIQQFCSESQPGREQKQCLMGHQGELAEECQRQLQVAQTQAQTRRKVIQSCQNDMNTFCPDSKPGSRAVLTCLKSNTNELSDACRSTIATQNQE